MDKLIVFIVGAKETGKTAISNHLAGLSESLTKEYRPTRGVRILEFDRKVEVKTHKKVKQITLPIELWDCSGELKYQSTWQAFSSSAAALVIVANPDIDQEKELELWHKNFSFLKENQIVIMSHSESEISNAKPKLDEGLAKMKIIQTTLKKPDEILSEFDKLVSGAFEAWNKSRENEENRLMAVN